MRELLVKQSYCLEKRQSRIALMIFENKKNNFLGIKNPKTSSSKVTIVPFGLENSVSYGKGTKNGPKEILKASQYLELYDEDLGYEPSTRIGIQTLKAVPIKKDITKALNDLEEIISNIIKKKKFPFILGGEHSVTIGAIKAFEKTKRPITIVQFDAHADLRNEYQSNKYSHASVMRRCLDYKNINLVSIGTRSISKDEISFLNKNSSRIKIFWAKDKKSWNRKEILSLIKGKDVYITFDLDSLDPSLMPSTGTPEPGGLFWDEAIELIKIISLNSNIIGADLNELAPIKNLSSPNFIAAKLAYKIISFALCSKKVFKYQ